MFRLCVLFLFISSCVLAHVGEHPSIHDTVHNIKHRLKQNFFDIQQLKGLDSATLEAFLTKTERETLGKEHISFQVNVPVVVSVIRDMRLGDEPFWLKKRQFHRTQLHCKVDNVKFDVWQKEFPAGWAGFGVNSLSGGNLHYFLAITPKNSKDKLKIDKMYPGQHTTCKLQVGEQPFVDSSEVIQSISPQLQGMTLIRTMQDRSEVAKLIGIFRSTYYPSSDFPDQIVLTWSENPRYTQTVQWRTSTNISQGVVRYREKAGQGEFKQINATTKLMETPDITNDPKIHRHTAVMRDLKADTTYEYAVGSGAANGWSKTAEFITAPDGEKPFSFVYMGDAQNGLDTWGQLLKNAHQAQPNAAFYLMAGDLVNRGDERWDWDSFFHNARGIYNRKQLAPTIGNHEMHGGFPSLYLEMFTLPKNGPEWLAPERAYSFEYSNACFIVLDTNTLLSTQTKWLEEQLKKTKATWKFVMYHHPAYSPRPSSNNNYIIEYWGALFDKYEVDVALQGHDHSYLRTFPVKKGKKVPGTHQGTTYIVSVSGTKFYEQKSVKFAEVAFTNISTYQVLDIEIRGKRMIYKAYDVNGVIKDEFVIEKP